MSDLRAPAPRPCGSCPYRRDVPPGVWDESEYEKLLEYDAPTWAQPPSAFLCHQQDGRLCAGWVAVHGHESLGFRIALGLMPDEEAEVAADYETDVPLFTSGAEAARHGLSQIEDPPPQARRMVERLARKQAQNDDEARLRAPSRPPQGLR